MRKILVLSLALILLLGIMSGGTSSYFSDTETSAGNTFTAWVEVCPPDSMVIVSDTTTQVTWVKGQPTPPPPQNAVLAWEHANWDSPTYNNVTTFFTGLEGTIKADWIWETEYTNDPGTWPDWPWGGDIVVGNRTGGALCK
ncbi:unnamed protein product, partial [marine sediment metagenome]